MKTKSISLAVSVAVLSCLSAHAADLGCSDISNLQNSVSKMHAEYNTLTANKDAAKKKTLKANIVAEQAKLDQAKTNCATPSVVMLPANTAPAAPAECSTFCGGPGGTCPVVKMNNITYWPYSYRDNRFATNLVGVDGSGKQVSQLNVPDVRYIKSIAVNTQANTITLTDERSATKTVPLSSLK